MPTSAWRHPYQYLNTSVKIMLVTVCWQAKEAAGGEDRHKSPYMFSFLTAAAKWNESLARRRKTRVKRRKPNDDQRLTAQVCGRFPDNFDCIAPPLSCRRRPSPITAI